MLTDKQIQVIGRDEVKGFIKRKLDENEILLLTLKQEQTKVEETIMNLKIQLGQLAC